MTTINQMLFMNNERAVLLFFGTVIFTALRGFYLFKVYNRNTRASDKVV